MIALVLAASASSAGALDVHLVSQTNSTITLGWTPQPGYGYLFSADGNLISRTNDPSRSTVKFSKGPSVFEVAVIVKGATGTYPPPAPAPQCSDGIDNDGDGLVDFPNDPGCSSATDNDETNVAPPPKPACSDSVDNDGDGKTDYPADPGCTSATDTDEADPVTTGCPSTVPNTPDGPDGNGGCFPGPKTTGVPAGTTLTNYTGSCAITTAGTVIDSKTVNCELVIRAANVTIRNSRVNGNVWLDQDISGSSGWSMTITDSEVVGPNQDIPAICCGMYTVVRVNAHGGHNGAQCENNNQFCTIRDSYLHDPYQPASGDSHLGGFLSDGSDNLTLTHNTVWCNAKVNSSGGGCTGDINLIPNFSPINNALIERNLLPANYDSSFCTYGGEKPSSQFPHSFNVKYRNNVFQRGTNNQCARYGPVTGFSSTNAGNEWTGNVWDNGGTVAPAN